MPLLLALTTGLSVGAGKRPYELEWAERLQDDRPPLVGFEAPIDWRVETRNAEAAFEITREQQIWGRFVGKLTYRDTGPLPEVRIVPATPVPLTNAYDTVSAWIYGNNWAYASDSATPSVNVYAELRDAAGNTFEIHLTHVHWKEWFLCRKRVPAHLLPRTRGGGSLTALIVRNGTNKDNRAIFIDNLAAFVDPLPQLSFKPRRQRGIPLLPGQDPGLNTGPGTLPFPTRPETILPDTAGPFTNAVSQEEDGTFTLTYDGPDGHLAYRLTPKAGTWSDLQARWAGRTGWIRPCVDGGIYLFSDNKPRPPGRAEHLGTKRTDETVVSRWRLTAGKISSDISYTYRTWGRSLVIDVLAQGGHVAEVRYGHAEGLDSPRLLETPYLTYGGNRPAVVVSGSPTAPLFLTGNTDWYLSNASAIWADSGITRGSTTYNGGTRYNPKTDGSRNTCCERFFVTIAPRYEDVLPNIPNPVSPWKRVTATRAWKAYGASNRQSDEAFWRRCHRFGMTEVVVTDHETMWRDGGESFTFRTRAAPAKGGDEGARAYARLMQDELGFVYGPYNNFTDFAPVNGFWDPDLVNRTQDGQLQGAWARCYAPKPSRAVEFCERLAPRIENKFHFSTAYCDVHTAVTPWQRVDYDARVPGAGTFAATFYPYGEIMLLQKAAWDGPVYSEGNMHWLYCGLTDGNYAQDRTYDFATQPWLVDFDLRKLHDLCCNFGMGNPGMFYGKRVSLGDTHKQVDRSIDRFLAATVAFGHTGFLTFERGFHNALRSYYMLQQLHGRYALSEVETIRYVAADGSLLNTSAAIAAGVHARSQIVTRYAEGCVTAVNGNPAERLRCTVRGHALDLPPNGYAGWTEDGAIEVLGGDPSGYRTDYAVTPAYIYVDGRGTFTRFDKAAADGIGICRILGDDAFEIIPYGSTSCGFAVGASAAVALDAECRELGPAEIRCARGLTYVMPVKDAVSYRVQGGPIAATRLNSVRDRVVPGEHAAVKGVGEHDIAIPADAKPGTRIWRHIEGEWIDFTVVPFVDTGLSLEGNQLSISLTSHLPTSSQFRVTAAGFDRNITLAHGKTDIVGIALTDPASEAAELLTIDISSGARRLQLERGMRVTRQSVERVPFPLNWQGGIGLRGRPESIGYGQTRAYIRRGEQTCDGERRRGLVAHPPYHSATGYAFARFDLIHLPGGAPAAFRALVGKGDNSVLGDGILYKVSVVDSAGREHVTASTVVTNHAWHTIEADLSAWEGQSVHLKLITDVGEEGDSGGDWACWADMRVESREPVLVRTLHDDPRPFRRTPGPHPVTGLSVAELRAAKRGWLMYDGIGLSGTGREYGSFAVLNGIEIGHMAAAAGQEGKGIWGAEVRVPLSGEVIATLDRLNSFELRNPRGDYFKVRRFGLLLELTDGRRCSSEISTAVYTQPPGWPHAEGIRVPFDRPITVDIVFPR